MITPAFGLTATERVLPRLALDFTTASLDPRITFTRTTGALNPATYIDSSGVIAAATNNQPRFDYDPVTLVCKGLLIEESRTNSLLNTGLLSTQIVTVTAAVRTLSFYGTGSVTLSGAHTAVVSGTGAYPTRTTYSFTPSAGTLTLTVTGTVQYAQLEAGAFATSYIPTTSAALTRNADVATMTGTNFSSWYNATEGTFVASFNRYAATSGFPRVLSCSDNTASNEIALYIANATARAQLLVIDATVTQCNAYSTYSTNTLSLSGRYKLNSFAGSLNGATPFTDSAGTVPSGITQMTIGTGPSTTSPTFNGHIESIQYWPQGLTNAEVQAIAK